MVKDKYTTGQVAKILGVHKNTVFYWLRTGKVKEPMRDKVFNGRVWTAKEIMRLKASKKDNITLHEKNKGII